MAKNRAALYKDKNIKSWRKNPSIPQEIIFDIFSWLPIKSLMRFKCISKFFNSLVSKSVFVDTHLSHSRTRTKLLTHNRDVYDGRDFFYTVEQIEDGKASLLHIEEFFYNKLYHIIYSRIGSLECVNGVFCFWAPAQQPVLICNPSTREVRYLPYIEKHYQCFYSLGFEPKEKIYKVLFTKIEYLRIIGNSESIARNWIFTLGTQEEESWKEIESIPGFSRLGRVCINGVIYMLNSNDHKHDIVVFDVKTESFKTIGLRKTSHRHKYNYELIDVIGKLAIFENKIINGEIDMWILEKGQWERHIIITMGFPDVSEVIKGFTKLFWCQTYDEGIIFTAQVKHNKFCYFFYDVTRKSWSKGSEIEELCEERRKFVGIYSWVESLFPLKKNLQQV